MAVHILGIAGTFMAGVALLARELNQQVSGRDRKVYPPMSQQLQELGIDYMEELEGSPLPSDAEIIVGNVMRRGMPVIEELLNRKLNYSSGPAWLSQHVLKGRQVLAVSGTHGKTSTASMLAWILESAGLKPGFLIGGIPHNFGVSARLGQGRYFVIEADEYDSAFFDKRSKFIHYRPDLLILNNLEFDHADIFDDLKAIQTQFHHLIRTLPSNGLILHPNTQAIQEVLDRGVWTPCQVLNQDWIGSPKRGYQQFEISYRDEKGLVDWSLMGQHNMNNGLAAVAAAYHCGVPLAQACESLHHFTGIQRRMELKGQLNGIDVWDDFAHHPTAIATTLAGLRAVHPHQSLIVVVDIRSNTMKAGHHQHSLGPACEASDVLCFLADPCTPWPIQNVWAKLNKPGGVYFDKQQLFAALDEHLSTGAQLYFMSNGALSGADFLQARKV